MLVGALIRHGIVHSKRRNKYLARFVIPVSILFFLNCTPILPYQNEGAKRFPDSVQYPQSFEKVNYGLTYFTSGSKHVYAVPGAVIAIQTFGDLLGYNSHLHVLISDGCFHENGLLTVAPVIDTQVLEQLFRHKVLKLLLSEGRITEVTVALMGKRRYLAMNRIFEDSGVFDGFVR
jgi:hypothetical protein